MQTKSESKTVSIQLDADTNYTATATISTDGKMESALVTFSTIGEVTITEPPKPKNATYTPPFFALKVMRQMRYSGAIEQLGIQVYALVCYVAERWDDVRYRGMLPLFNGQLQSALGFSDWRTLEKVRNKAIEAGWLKYEYKGNRQAGLYAVQIPADCMHPMQVYEDIPAPIPVSAPVITTALVLPNPNPLKYKEETFPFSQKEERQDKPKPPKPKKPKPPTIDPLTYEIPERFRTPEILAAWADYCEMRATRTKTAVDTPLKCKLLWNKLDGYEPRLALATIERATAREWLEFFPAKEVQPQPPQRPQAAPQAPKPLTGNRPPRNRNYGGADQ